MRGKEKRSGIIDHLALIVILALVSGWFVQNDVLWRWDNVLYDAQMSFWSRAVSDDIIIVAIDDESLNKLGRWPWPRSVHAQLINKLELESPRVIGLDIIFNEPDASGVQSDQLLAQAIQASGKIVLPIFMYQKSKNSYPIEALPLPVFSDKAAALGHVHIDISDDGIARRVYLREGIGDAHWMHYSLAVLAISDPSAVSEHKTDVAEPQGDYSVMEWSRKLPFLIPYAGPPGHFQQIGYSQVMSGHYPKDLFRDKIVLIGATAKGMGDALPTPLSGDGGLMPGVEIVANIIDAAKKGLRISDLGIPWLIVITIVLVALPVIIYPFLNPASTLLVLFSIVMTTLASAALLLWFFGLWVPTSTILLFQLIGYPLWSWRRLELAMKHINIELDQLAAKQKVLSMRRERDITNELRFIAQFIPIKGWVLQDEAGFNYIKKDIVPTCSLNDLKPEGWSKDGCNYWAPTRYKNKPAKLGLSMATDKVMTANDMRLLNSLIHTPLSAELDDGVYAEDLVQSKIQQVQAVGREYEELRRIIDDSLSSMADGVLICNSCGQVMLSNRRAGWYLYNDDNAEINGESLINVLTHIRLKDGGDWMSLVKNVLFRQERRLANAQHEAGRHLMVEISPLRLTGDVFDGFVVNFSDITLLKESERKRNEILDFISHDLRSPLSSMIAKIELAKNRKSVDGMRAMLDGMEKNTHKTLHLAEQFLQLSRANTTENIRFYDIDFNSVVLNAIDQLWALSDKMNITIAHEFDTSELWTHAEADLLERAIINLLSNAIKYSREGGTIRVTTSLQEGDIICSVIDQGIGISAEEMPYLFEMFRRVRGEGVERKQGVGLGLAFVDAVAKRHAGRVDVKSTLGEGSTFCFRLPLIEQQA